MHTSNFSVLDTSDILEESQKIDCLERSEISLANVSEGADEVEIRHLGTQDTSYLQSPKEENLVDVPLEIEMENSMPNGSLEESK